jgi:HAD superfamily hydrolase (TIGR01509 family)
VENKMIKAIIFDFDGVICNTQDLLYDLHLKHLEEISLDKFKENVFNGNPNDYFEKFNSKQKENFSKNYIKLNATLKLEENIRKILLELDKKYDLFIISNSWKKALDNFFENNNFTNIFKKIYSREYSKTKVERFYMLFEEFNLNKEEVIFVTDTLGDIIEANEVQVKTIAVDFGVHDRKTLEKGKPFKIVSKFEEIPEIIKNKL